MTDLSTKRRQKPSTINNNSSLKIHPEPFAVPNFSVHDDYKYRYIVNQFYEILRSVTNNDRNRFESIVDATFLEDCLVKTPALSKPVVGRHYFKNMLQSVLSSFVDKSLEPYTHDKIILNGSTVVTVSYIFQGKLR